MHKGHRGVVVAVFRAVGALAQRGYLSQVTGKGIASGLSSENIGVFLFSVCS